MLFIDNRGITDAALNLALEEYALYNLPLDEPCLLFYINAPSIIVGRNQNTIEEVNSDYVASRGIQVVRRLSGGGAVYHDLGNLNYSILTKDDGQSFHNFARFTKPVTDALNKMGVPAALTGRNDIQVEERKISGNAQFFSKGRIFTHGTLLFDSELTEVANALKVKPIKIASKSTKSVRGRVANISEFLPERMRIEEFRRMLLRELFGCAPEEVPVYPMTEHEWEEVRRIADARYRSWDWNYGRSPESNIEHTLKFPSGIIDMRLLVKDGRIEQVRLFGDYFGAHDVAELETLLVGVRYDEAALDAVLAQVELARYFGAIERSDLLDLLLPTRGAEA
ncbi:lipoate--protein ligase [Paenibacillus sp. IB182496]|uniref:lipoate--protein ligase n=1 Tax=Paenibacillus sabuli TaxID=2772509 RepID=A0A927BQV2_9BACL|nr:lipoate--protein ligase [Paenibacillus sabuli]MBD2843874.1 lipoate--protein ligase [Paenibacillus sabuli]